MSPIDIVKQIPESPEQIKKIEELAKNKLKSMTTELTPIATHLAAGVIANIGVIKFLGGDEFIPAIGAATIASGVSSGLEKIYNVEHIIPKIIVGSSCYTATAMLTTERVPLKEALIMGVGTSIISELVMKFLPDNLIN